MIFLFLTLLTGALIVSFFQKYILRVKEPDIEELWRELEEQKWYQELRSDPKRDEFLYSSKLDGLLHDPYYVRKIIDKEGHRDGFIRHVKEKA